MKETLWDNNFNFVKDVAMIHLNFIIIVVTDSEKKNRRNYFCTDLRIIGGMRTWLKY
jgi:hypothetical protein